MNPKCVQCEKTDSILWRKNSENAEICNDCFESESSVKPEEVSIKDEKCNPDNEKTETPPKEIESTAPETSKVRKSTRSTRFKSKAVTRQKSKSMSRRAIFKLNKPCKTPSNICAETKTKKSLFVDGFYYQIGDIVSIKSKGKKYYAQIRALIVDTFCEKSAVLTWLLPTTSSPDPEEEFDPATYLIGPEEDLPRKIKNVMTFEMHAPSNYFHCKSEPFPKPDSMEDGLYSEKNKKGFIWQSI